MFVPWNVLFLKTVSTQLVERQRKRGKMARWLFCCADFCPARERGTWCAQKCVTRTRLCIHRIAIRPRHASGYGLYSTTLKVNWIKADVRRNHTSLEHFYASVIIMVFVGAASFRDIVTNDASIQCHRGSEDILGVPYIICINIWIYIHPYMHPYIHPYMQLRFSRSMFSLPHLSALCHQIACHENELNFKKSFIMSLHCWLLSPLWSRAMMINVYMMNAKVVTRE